MPSPLFYPENPPRRCGLYPLRRPEGIGDAGNVLYYGSYFFRSGAWQIHCTDTDGRFSGASKGPAIGHVSPEAADGGPIALVEEDDLIRIDIPARVLEIIGVKGRELPPEEIAKILEERRANLKPREPKYKKGVLKIYSEHAVSPMKGGYME